LGALESGASRDPKNPPFCKIAFFFLRETDFFVSALNLALFLLSFSFWSLVNGTLPLKILSAHSHRQSTRLRSALVMRWLRIHGLAFCKDTKSLTCFFNRGETMLLLLHLS
jgi:hypothetical protein